MDGLNHMARFCYFYDRNDHTIALSEAEALHVTGGEIVAHGVIECDKSVDWSNAGYLRGGGKLIASGKTLSEICEKLSKMQFSATGEYKIITEPIPGERSGEHRAIVAVANSISGKVNLRTPLQIFTLIVSDEGYWFIDSELPENHDWRKFKYKPHTFCNALPVRAGRAVLNLCSEPNDIVFDPCCGSGTIPLLASSMGRVALGGDISWPNFNIARNNIKHFGYEAELKQEDATQTTRKADCVVTNLPYGLYLPIPEETLLALLKNFRNLAPKVVLITTMDIDKRLLDIDYKIEQKIVTRRMNLERHFYFLKS